MDETLHDDQVDYADATPSSNQTPYQTSRWTVEGDLASTAETNGGGGETPRVGPRDELLNGPALFPGDRGELSMSLRQALIRLLRGPYVDGSTMDGSSSARAYSHILAHRAALAIRLNELFLRLVIDEDRKIALLAPVDMPEPFTSPLQRQRELSREETLVLLRMRLILDRQSGTGKESTIDRSEVLEIFAQHLPSGSQDAKRVEDLADQTIRRLVNDRRLLLPTELPGVFIISHALPLALPFEQIGDIKNLMDSIAQVPRSDDDGDSHAGADGDSHADDDGDSHADDDGGASGASGAGNPDEQEKLL